MKKFLNVKFPLVLSMALCLIVALSGCIPAGDGTQSTAEPSSAPSSVEPVLTPEAAPSETVPSATDPWQVDESLLTDDYLLSMVADFELAMGAWIGQGFSFEETVGLTDENALYLAFLLLSDYDELEEKYWDAEEGRFYFTNDVITACLSKYFKVFTFDITQDENYDAEVDAIVTPLASGFGGDIYMELTDKQVDGNIVTFTADFYEDYERQGAVFMTKTYGIEFYEGGWYYLYASEL